MINDQELPLKEMALKINDLGIPRKSQHAFNEAALDCCARELEEYYGFTKFTFKKLFGDYAIVLHPVDYPDMYVRISAVEPKRLLHRHIAQPIFRHEYVVGDLTLNCEVLVKAIDIDHFGTRIEFAPNYAPPNERDLLKKLHGNKIYDAYNELYTVLAENGIHLNDFSLTNVAYRLTAQDIRGFVVDAGAAILQDKEFYERYCNSETDGLKLLSAMLSPKTIQL